MGRLVDSEDDDSGASDAEAVIFNGVESAVGPNVENVVSDGDDEEDVFVDDFFGLDYNLIEEFSQINVNFACCRKLCLYAFEVNRPGEIERFRERRETFCLSITRAHSYPFCQRCGAYEYKV